MSRQVNRCVECDRVIPRHKSDDIYCSDKCENRGGCRVDILSSLVSAPKVADEQTELDAALFGFTDPDTCYAPVGESLHCGAPIGECKHTRPVGVENEDGLYDVDFFAGE